MSRKYSTPAGANSVASSSKLNPSFITGFSDVEASFIIRVNKYSRYSSGWAINAIFSIGLHLEDLPLLLNIQ